MVRWSFAGRETDQLGSVLIGILPPGEEVRCHRRKLRLQLVGLRHGLASGHALQDLAKPR